jgi:hypothetical protein
VTLNNIPIPNVNVKLEYRIGQPIGGGSTRKIVNTQSNKNGEYNKNFYIKDTELGNNAFGYFTIKIDDSSVDSNRYIKSNNNYNFTQPLGYTIYSITRRDTIIDDTFYFPKKAFIKVNLNNFVPQEIEDYFEVQTLYPFGPKIGVNKFLDSPYATGLSGYGNFRASGLNTLLNVFVAEGEKNIIRVIRRKKGVGSSEDFEINIPPNNTIELTYNY